MKHNQQNTSKFFNTNSSRLINIICDIKKYISCFNPKVIGVLLINVSVLAACTDEIHFRGEITEPKLVVHSYITPGEPINAIITLSRFFLNDSTEYVYVSDADVSVYVNNEFVEKLTVDIDPWRRVTQYKGEYIPKHSDKIKLVVKRPKMAEVTAESHFEKPIEILKIDTVRTKNELFKNYANNELVSYLNSFSFDFELSFKDDGKKKDYYRLLVETWEMYKWGTWDWITSKSSSKINFTDVVSGNNNNKNPLENAYEEVTGTTSDEVVSYNVFTDDLFNGKAYNLKFSGNYGITKFTPKFENENKKEKIILRISIQSITKEYYEYLASRSASLGVNQFFSEPVQIKSNIKGGIGVLGAYTSSNVMEYVFE